MDIKEEYIGYNNKSIPDTFFHLCKSYGKVTDSDLLSNKEAMSKQWDPDTPTQTICKQVEDGVKFTKLVGMITQDK